MKPKLRDYTVGARAKAKRDAQRIKSAVSQRVISAERAAVPLDPQSCAWAWEQAKAIARKQRLEGFGYENRRGLTPGEVAMQELLKSMGFRFNVEHPIGGYILDFYIAEHRLAIEVDGGYHDTPEQRAKDKKRDRYLVWRGLKVIRFTNEQVIRYPKRCRASILELFKVGRHERVLETHATLSKSEARRSGAPA